jgi:hypothetical protein
MTNRYQELDDLEAVIRGFENCTTPKEEFSHQSHLTVAAYYLHHFTLEQSISRLRTGLFRFITHHGVPQQKYHETITIFWFRVIKEYMDQNGADRSLLVLTNELLERFSEARLVSSYYSKDLLQSDEARNGWVEPDLKPITGG